MIGLGSDGARLGKPRRQAEGVPDPSDSFGGGRKSGRYGETSSGATLQAPGSWGTSVATAEAVERGGQVSEVLQRAVVNATGGPGSGGAGPQKVADKVPIFVKDVGWKHGSGIIAIVPSKGAIRPANCLR